MFSSFFGECLYKIIENNLRIEFFMLANKLLIEKMYKNLISTSDFFFLYTAFTNNSNNK